MALTVEDGNVFMVVVTLKIYLVVNIVPPNFLHINLCNHSEPTQNRKMGFLDLVPNLIYTSSTSHIWTDHQATTMGCPIVIPAQSTTSLCHAQILIPMFPPIRICPIRRPTTHLIKPHFFRNFFKAMTLQDQSENGLYINPWQPLIFILMPIYRSSIPVTQTQHTHITNPYRPMHFNNVLI